MSQRREKQYRQLERRVAGLEQYRSAVGAMCAEILEKENHEAQERKMEAVCDKWMAVVGKVLTIGLVLVVLMMLRNGGKLWKAVDELEVLAAQGVAVAETQTTTTTVAAVDIATLVEEEPLIPLNANTIENCAVTYYCCEQYDHICGNGEGITASGTEITPGRTVAVDTGMIPFGSTVWVVFDDGTTQEYIAEDVGSAIKGGRIDIAVETHQEALDLGVDIATVYWVENG